MKIARRGLWVIAAVLALVLQLGVLNFLRPVLGLVSRPLFDTFEVARGAPQAIPNIDTSESGPGTLLSATTMPTLDPRHMGSRIKAARVLYTSTVGDTSDRTVVSGSVFIPVGAAPPDGWPVVAVGHGTVGINNDCAPSLTDNLDGLSATVRWLVEHGYAVALTDYQGLGAKGVHPYLDARTAGRNMIDSVRALRHTFPGVISDRWAALGHSQGGAAAWAADEQALIYGPELHLVGAVAMAPAADVSGMVDKAFQGRLTPDQPMAFQAIVESMARVYPKLIHREDFTTLAARKNWDKLSACSGLGIYLRGFYANKLGPKDIAPQSQAAADRLRLLLQAWALPQRPLAAPLSVWYGGADTLVDAQWTAGAIKAACKRGGIISIEFEPTKGHGDFDLMGQAKWMLDRFAGVPADNDCDNHDAFPS
jgi:pimeloyl-ACP methyl ester carboxylesterase